MAIKSYMVIGDSTFFNITELIILRFELQLYNYILSFEVQLLCSVIMYLHKVKHCLVMKSNGKMI